MNLAPLVEQYIWRTEIPLTRSVIFAPKVALISVEILVTVVVWVLARTPPTFIVRPAVDQNLGGTQPWP